VISPRSIELLETVRSLDLEGVERSLREGADPNCHDQDEYSPLMLSVISQQPVVPESIRVRIATLLLNAGACVDHKSPTGTTALMLAALMGYAEVVEFLLQRDADPNVQNALTDSGCSGGCSALHYAVANGHVEVIERLIHHGADVNLPRASEELPFLPLDFADRPSPLPNRDAIIELLEAAGAKRSGHSVSLRERLGE
jgi:ankyrin repeat protein